MPNDRRIIIGLVLSLCTACGNGRESDWAGTIDTLAHGTVIVSNPAEPVWGPEEGWTVTEELRIGAVEGDGPEVFGALKDFVVDADGRMYVLDSQAQEIRVFDSEGRHVRAIGRRGGGPGEFENVWGMAFAPDGSLWVVDTRNARFSVFDTAGTFVTSIRRDISGWNYIWPGIFDNDGKLLDYFVGRDPYVQRVDVGLIPPAVTEGDVAADVALGDTRAVWTRDSIRMDVLDSNIAIPSFEAQFVRFERVDGSGRRFMQMPFAARLMWLLDPRGYLWFGKTDEYRVYQRTLGGDTVRIIDVAAEPRPVTDADRDSVLALVEETKADGYKTEFSPSDIPATKPFFEQITLDDQGYLWLWVETLATETVYDVFDRVGRYLGNVRVPFSVARFRQPTIRGEQFYAVTRDELDVPYLVRARVERLGTP